MHSHQQRSRILVAGGLDLAAAPHVRTAIEEVAGPGQVVLVDLERVVFCNCVGLDVLVKNISSGPAMARW